MAEALVARCAAAVAQCRVDLAELSAACAAARSHKELCSALAAAAAEAVAGLEQLAALAAAEPGRLRSAQKLATAVQSALDQGDAVVRTYGHQAGLLSVLSRLASRLDSSKARASFEALTSELQNLGKKARYELQKPSSEPSARTSVATTASSHPFSSQQLPDVGPAVGALQQEPPAAREAAGADSATGNAGGGSDAAASSLPAGVEELGAAAAGVAAGTAAGEAAGAAAAGAPAAGPLARSISLSTAISWEDLECTTLLQEGDGVQVWRGRWQETAVAIKKAVTVAAQAPLQNEVALLKDMRHPCIVLYIGLALEPAALVTEFCARGSVQGLLAAARGGGEPAQALSWPRRVQVALDAAKGLMYLHGKRPPIVHRGLTSAHLLVDMQWKTKLAGLSCAGPAAPAAPGTPPPPSTLQWQAPEVIKAQQYGKESDVYAFGLILWELLTWQLPFAHLPEHEIAAAVAEQGQRPPLPTPEEAQQLPGGSFDAYPAYAGLIQRCWAQRPEQRPPIEQVARELRELAQGLPEAEAAE